MNKPSVGALNTVKAILILLGNAEHDLTWEAAKKLMVNPKVFKQKLLTFKKDSIPEKIIKRVIKLSKLEDFSATKAPKAAAVFTKWILAIVELSKNAYAPDQFF